MAVTEALRRGPRERLGVPDGPSRFAAGAMAHACHCESAIYGCMTTRSPCVQGKLTYHSAGAEPSAPFTSMQHRKPRW